MTSAQQGRFEVDATRPLPLLGGGAEAFAVHGHDGLMAIRVVATAPPRPQPFARLVEVVLPGVSTPVAHVAARFADGLAPALVCTRPVGDRLGSGLRPARVWTEGELIACVLRPIVAALAGLQALGVTHRAIRLDNVFQTKPGAPVTLGEAWSRPPAMLQPAWGEPRQSATCHPAGRGNGTTADDVYALGALLILLARGGDVALADAPVSQIVAAKLLHGSYGAMSTGARLPAIIADLTRGMLADDPEHRPQPSLLADPEAARVRRVPSPPTRRAQRPLAVGATQTWDAGDLAQRIALEPATIGPLLAGGKLERWLSLSLGEPQLAAGVEAIRRSMADTPLGVAAASCHVVALLDPLAPLCWPGLRCWPDGMGPLLTQGPDVAQAIAGMATADVVPGWAQRRSDAMCEALGLMEWRPLRSAHRGNAANLARLRYERNPMLACGGALAGQGALTADDLLPALEAMARLPGRAPLPLDAEAIAFAAIRCRMPSAARVVQTAASQLELLVRIEGRAGVAAPPTPALAAWLVEGLAGQVAAWPGTAARRQLALNLAATAARGVLAPIEVLLFTSGRRAADLRAAAAARQRIAEIDLELSSEGVRPARNAAAGEVGREFAVACSALFAVAAVLATVLA